MRRRHRHRHDWEIVSRGRYRSVTVCELVAHDAVSGRERSGWFARQTVAMDESLTRVIGNVESMSGFGAIDVSEDAQWLDPPQPGVGSRLAIASGIPPELVPAIAAAAQRYDQRQPSPSPGTFVPADAPLLPDGYDARVTAVVTLIFPSSDPPGTILKLGADLAVHDAILAAGAQAESEALVDGARYRLHATLAPDTPRAPTPTRVRENYRGTLTVSVSDERGNRWQRSFPASGPIDREGDAAVAPTGFVIPGATWPSPEAEARRFTLPGFGRYHIVKGEVESLFKDPRP
jgi:hypothetical protein